MAKLTKNQKKFASKIDPLKAYSLQDASKLIKEISYTKFDSSIDRGKPIQFQLGVGQVIPGWDEGISLLKVGEKAHLIIPAKLAYGDQGTGGVIPPNATIVFDVELVSVQ